MEHIDIFDHPYYGEVTGEKIYKIVRRAAYSFYVTQGDTLRWFTYHDYLQEAVVAFLLNITPHWHFIALIKHFHGKERDERNHLNLDDEIMASIEADSTVLDTAMGREFFNKIKNDKLKGMIADRYFDEMTAPEIAKKYRLTSGSVRTMMSKEIRRLRDLKVVKVPCKTCGEIHDGSYGNNRRFCSKECAKLYVNKIRWDRWRKENEQTENS